VALRRKTRVGTIDPRMPLFPGFSEVSEIGRGSLAAAFRAREIGTNRLVALKLLNVRDASPRALESFERESIALGALSSHPNIVTLYRQFPASDGRPVLVLELCRGAVSDQMRLVPDGVCITEIQDSDAAVARSIRCLTDQPRRVEGAAPNFLPGATASLAQRHASVRRASTRLPADRPVAGGVRSVALRSRAARSTSIH
jgi:Protein kinase domain